MMLTTGSSSRSNNNNNSNSQDKDKEEVVEDRGMYADYNAWAVSSDRL